METIILAAGSSSRMEGQVKLLLPFRGKPLIATALEAALDASERVIVVTGAYVEQIEETLAEYLLERVTVVRNLNFQQGQLSSTQVGAEALSPGANFFISMADLPLIESRHYRELTFLLQEWDVVRPHYQGRPGHPVLFNSQMRNKILALPPGSTMRTFVASQKVLNYQSSDSAWVIDIDTPADYRNLIFQK